MNWKNVGLIFMREVRDQLRDRRTLFMIVVLPLLLYPIMGFGMMQMTSLFREQPRTVAVLGAQYLPDEPKFINENRIVSNWFRLPSDSKKLNVVTEQSQTGGDAAETAEVFQQAREFAEMRRKFVELKNRHAVLVGKSKTSKKPSDSAGDGEIERLLNEINDSKTAMGRLLTSSAFDVLIIIQPGFGETIERESRRLVERVRPPPRSSEFPRPIVIYNSANRRSQIAHQRVKTAVAAWENEILKRRLDAAGLPPSTMKPVDAVFFDLANTQEISNSIWSVLFPALLVIMALTGAFYPAVDLAAGEKERGTMETLLICPAKRSEIVVGKFLTVMIFSLSTVVLNLVSMGMTGKYLSTLGASGALARFGVLALPSALTLFWVVLLLIPLAAFFSALCLALATFARSSKEGQYYLTPLLLVTVGLTGFCLSPLAEIQPFYSVVPVMGPALLLKELIASSGRMDPLPYVFPVLASSIGYSLLALWWAVEQFGSEEVLFREAERFDARLWVRNLLRDKHPTPSFSKAVFCFVLIMMLQFVAFKFFQGAIKTPDDANNFSLIARLLVIQQLALIALPALLMGILLTSNVVRTFRLRMPNWKILGAAIVLPLMLHPLSLELSARLEWFFPPLPEEIGKFFGSMTESGQIWIMLLAIALAPAVCEEVAFRGFILNGFQRSGRIGLAVVLSSLMFGIMHIIPQQVFNAALVGLVLGLIAVRGKSLWPCIAFHFIYNTMGIMHGVWSKAKPDWLEQDSAGWFAVLRDGSIRYQPVTLLIAALTSAVLIYWLIGYRGSKSTQAHSVRPTDPSEDIRETDVKQEPPVSAG